MKTFQQSRGSNVDFALGFESDFGSVATSGNLVKFNSLGLTSSRELNKSGTIQPGRSPIEPFQGNGTVEGNSVLPLDINQLGVFLKAAFGAPTTTQVSAGTTASVTRIEGGTGYTAPRFYCSNPTDFSVGDKVRVAGSVSYNGVHAVTEIQSSVGYVVLDAESVEDSSTTGVTMTVVGTAAYSHVFRIGDSQPSCTIEKVFRDIAEKETYLGCKVSSIRIGADASGQENTVEFGWVGCKPQTNTAPLAITAVSGSGSSVTFTTSANHGFAVGDEVLIAGFGSAYDGRHAVTAKTDDTFTVVATYAATSITVGQEPGVIKVNIKAPTPIALRRLGTFSAGLKKDGVTYRTAKEFTINFDMGLDTDQRCIGDEGYVSSLPEGTVGISVDFTCLFNSGDLYRKAQANDTIGWAIKYVIPGTPYYLEISLPECKVQEAGVPVETAMGISQTANVQAFCSTADEGGSAAFVTLVNERPSI
jgi:hypothetical protein